MAMVALIPEDRRAQFGERAAFEYLDDEGKRQEK